MFSLLYTQMARFAAPLYKDILWRHESIEKTVYLSIDDSPSQYTERFLSVLADVNALATFFVIGQNAEKYPHILSEIRQAGHTIGNHSFAHRNAWTMRPDVLQDDLKRSTDLIEAQIGNKVRHLRPPFGRFNRTMRNWCIENEQQLVMWDVFPTDFYPATSEQNLVHFILRSIRNGSILVLHDHPNTFDKTPAVLKTVLHVLTDRGWQFRPLP
jgi:peptidoglycan/xylan/chitin deacetylase (PgdA/CDA1 family)